MDEYWVVSGWEYANEDVTNPTLIRDFWVECVFDDGDEAYRYADRLSAIHEASGGDITYAVSGPFALNAASF